MDPNQQPTNYQPPSVAPAQTPMQQVPTTQPMVAAPQVMPGATINAFDEVQTKMRTTILKIIGGMVAVSILGVGGIFVLSTSADEGLTSRVEVNNKIATYEVPTSWQEDTDGSASSFTDAATPEGSQANMVVIEPIKVTYDSTPISESQVSQLMDQYEEAVTEGSGLKISNREKIEVDGFTYAFEYDISGTASDGKTKLSGVSHVLFDEANYIHTVEFIAVNNYWQSNKTQILEIVNTYKLK
jgi:hypothetical protein